MQITNNKLTCPYAWINDVSEETEELFEQDDISYSIGVAIFEYRKIHNLSQGDLADIIGVSQQWISQLENGKHSPSNKLLWTLAKKLDLDFAVQFQPSRKELEGRE